MGYSVYIHVPFCRKSRCPYCDFYSEVIVSNDNTARFVDRVLEEIDQRILDFTGFGEVESVFFGGGTPSVLSADGVKKIIDRLNAHSPLTVNAEITLESNPEDISAEYCEALLRAGVNRLSIGVQSLDDKYLKRLGRLHDAGKAIEAIKDVQSAGFGNISADLIFAGPGSSEEMVKRSVEKLVDTGIRHISAYGYYLEPGATAFGNRLYAGSDDESYRGQYLAVCEMLGDYGWRHYEISNWAAGPDLASRHNLAYWTGKPYLGLGPSAHSFLPPDTRVSVPANLKNYFKNFSTEKEKLGPLEIFHEKLMLALRLDSGLEIDNSMSTYKEKLILRFERLIEKRLVVRQNNGDMFFLGTVGCFMIQ